VAIECYLEGATFTVVTDHVSNTFFQTQPSLSRRQARWSEFFQRFGPINWVLRAGRDNVADSLSKYPLDTLTALLSAPRISHGEDDDVHLAELNSESSAMLAMAVTRREKLPSKNRSGQTASAESNTLDTSDLTFDLPNLSGKAILWESQSLRAEILRDANSAETRLLSVYAQGFVVKGSCIIVPDNSDLRKLIIREAHDSPYAGHYGITKTRPPSKTATRTTYCAQSLTLFLVVLRASSIRLVATNLMGFYNRWSCLKDRLIPSAMTLLQSCL
jgi:hypothetical protein